MLVSGLGSEDMSQLLKAIQTLRISGPHPDLVLLIEASRESPPSLSRGNSREVPKKGKFKAFFSNLFGHKQESEKLPHTTSIESKATHSADRSTRRRTPVSAPARRRPTECFSQLFRLVLHPLALPTLWHLPDSIYSPLPLPPE